MATEPVDAATVMLLRDGAGGLEVFMLERHIESEFAGGAFVFPGGKVDAADRELDERRRTGLADEVVARMGGDRERVVGLHVAAVRETFEEAGVLLAGREDGAPLDVDAPSFVAARRRLAARGERWDWRPWLEEEGLVLDLGTLAWWSWWVTPEAAPKRYDTRFFVALASEGDAPDHDRVEATDSRWVTPGGALDAARRGEVHVVYPTRRNLAALAPYRSARDAWRAAAEGEVDVRRVLPEAGTEDGGLVIRHPYDASVEPFDRPPA